MDLASVYRSLVRKHFPNARIVAFVGGRQQLQTASQNVMFWL